MLAFPKAHNEVKKILKMEKPVRITEEDEATLNEKVSNIKKRIEMFRQDTHTTEGDIHRVLKEVEKKK